MFTTNNLLYDNRERCVRPRGIMYHALEAQKIRNTIRTMVDEGALLDYSVGVSGSTALSWKIHEDPGKHSQPRVYFRPCDCDIFVCRKHCLDEKGTSVFNSFVHACLHRLLEGGYKAYDLHMWKHQYIHVNEDTMMAEFWVEGIRTKFSLIECSREETVFDVVKLFDFDLVQAVYDFRNKKVLMDAKAEQNLSNGLMKVSQCLADTLDQMEEGLAEGDLMVDNSMQWKLSSTIGRIRKYELRGFTVAHAEEWRDRMEKILDEVVDAYIMKCD